MMISGHFFFLLRAFFVSSLMLSTYSAYAFIIPVPNAKETVTQVNSNYRYDYRVNLDCTGSCAAGPMPGFRTIVNFYLPYFSDAVINNIHSPSGWQTEVMAQDVFQLGHGAQTLRWFTSAQHGIELNSTLAGFGYTSSFGRAAAPYQISYLDGDNYLFNKNDGLSIPFSANAKAAGLVSAVPEPSSWILLSAGLGIFSGVRRRLTPPG